MLISLSPIELCWSKVTQFLRSCEARTLESLDQAMALAVNYITEDDAYEKVQSLWSIYLKIAVTSRITALRNLCVPKNPKTQKPNSPDF